jgi:hypothetical protein
LFGFWAAITHEDHSGTVEIAEMAGNIGNIGMSLERQFPDKMKLQPGLP